MYAEAAWDASCTVIPMTRPSRKATAADGLASKKLRNMDAHMIHAYQHAAPGFACQPTPAFGFRFQHFSLSASFTSASPGSARGTIACGDRVLRCWRGFGMTC